MKAARGQPYCRRSCVRTFLSPERTRTHHVMQVLSVWTFRAQNDLMNRVYKHKTPLLLCVCHGCEVRLSTSTLSVLIFLLSDPRNGLDSPIYLTLLSAQTPCCQKLATPFSESSIKVQFYQLWIRLHLKLLSSLIRLGGPEFTVRDGAV